MDDSEGVFGGNGSVEWAINTGNNPKWESSVPKQPKGHKHAGAEETPSAPNDYFTVIVKRPANDDDVKKLAGTVATWLKELENPSIQTSFFALRIEKNNNGQIRVTWKGVAPTEIPQGKGSR